MIVLSSSWVRGGSSWAPFLSSHRDPSQPKFHYKPTDHTQTRHEFPPAMSSAPEMQTRFSFFFFWLVNETRRNCVPESRRWERKQKEGGFIHYAIVVVVVQSIRHHCVCTRERERDESLGFDNKKNQARDNKKFLFSKNVSSWKTKFQSRFVPDSKRSTGIHDNNNNNPKLTMSSNCKQFVCLVWFFFLLLPLKWISFVPRFFDSIAVQPERETKSRDSFCFVSFRGYA